MSWHQTEQSSASRAIEEFYSPENRKEEIIKLTCPKCHTEFDYTLVWYGKTDRSKNNAMKKALAKNRMCKICYRTEKDEIKPEVIFYKQLDSFHGHQYEYLYIVVQNGFKIKDVLKENKYYGTQIVMNSPNKTAWNWSKKVFKKNFDEDLNKQLELLESLDCTFTVDIANTGKEFHDKIERALTHIKLKEFIDE